MQVLPGDTAPVSVKQREAWWGSLPIVNRGELSLPGCCPQLADRWLLDLFPHHPIVSAKAAEASKLGVSLAKRGRIKIVGCERSRARESCGQHERQGSIVGSGRKGGEKMLP